MAARDAPERSRTECESEFSPRPKCGGRKTFGLRVKTGPRKTPDGYYLVVAEGDEYALERARAMAEAAGALVERAGDKLLIKVRSRRVRDKLFKRMKRSFAEAAGR